MKKYFQQLKKRIKKRIQNKLIAFMHPPQVKPPFFTKVYFQNKKYQIGEYTYGKPNVLFENEDTNLSIGKFCSISDEVTIFLGGNHRTDWISTYPFNAIHSDFPEAKTIEGHPATKGDVVIKNDVWIGRNAIIMSGVTIGNGAVIAAGTIVTKDIGDYEVWGGNPAVLLKKRFEQDTIQKLLKIKWWNWEISKIKKSIPLLCSSSIDSFFNDFEHE